MPRLAACPNQHVAQPCDRPPLAIRLRFGHACIPKTCMVMDNKFATLGGARSQLNSFVERLSSGRAERPNAPLKYLNAYSQVPWVMRRTCVGSTARPSTESQQQAGKHTYADVSRSPGVSANAPAFHKPFALRSSGRHLAVARVRASHFASQMSSGC